MDQVLDLKLKYCFTMMEVTTTMINKYDYDHDDQTTRDNKTKGQKNKRDKQTKRTKREIYIVMSVLHYCDDAAITREIKVKIMIMFNMLKMMMIKTVMVIGKTLRGGVDPDINVKMPSRTKGGITETVIKVIDKMNIFIYKL